MLEKSIAESPLLPLRISCGYVEDPVTKIVVSPALFPSVTYHLEVPSCRPVRFSGSGYFMLEELLQWFPVHVREQIHSQKSPWSLGANQLRLREGFTLGEQIYLDRDGTLES